MRPKSSDSSSDHTQLVQQYFNDQAQVWHDYYQGTQSMTHVILNERKQIALEYLNRHLPSRHGEWVLDAGCGSGLIAVEMACQGYRVHGWDISQEMISISKQNFAAAQIPAAQYKLTLGDLLASDLAPDSFAGIVALGFLQYQPDEHAALTRLHHLLRPGGIMVLSGPVRTRLASYFGVASWIKRWRQRKKNTATNADSTKMKERQLLHTISSNSYSMKRFKTLLRAANFEVLACRGHGYAHFEFISRRLRFQQELALHRNLTRLSKYLPVHRYANDMVVVART